GRRGGACVENEILSRSLGANERAVSKRNNHLITRSHLPRFSPRTDHAFSRRGYRLSSRRPFLFLPINSSTLLQRCGSFTTSRSLLVPITRAHYLLPTAPPTAPSALPSRPASHPFHARIEYIAERFLPPPPHARLQLPSALF
ncbi:hypothetical protein FB107DRAFT_193293, partial [Schizophyllum commune]